MRVLALSLLVGCSSPPASPPRFAQSATGWQHLQRLAGAWSGTTDSGAKVDIDVRPIANASTLAETFGKPGRETMTLYHADNGGLVATHYCAQGNQPRLRATTIDRDRIVFEQADVTDLDRTEAHLVSLEITFSTSAFERVEVYRDADGKLERTTWRFVPR
jgi:hypothetical protein